MQKMLKRLVPGWYFQALMWGNRVPEEQMPDDWGPVCECCGWVMEEVMPDMTWCSRCHWTDYGLQTQAGFEYWWEKHREVCKYVTDQTVQ
ncbi:hypothetical protein LCGC14_2356180 [marine sediment metagenome]|uniref:Cysteine-rich CPCC domain-containing protein n=1 Tax=marine sediment metagenome TaxID=412755 RepID=A0A0F9C8A3_9ZZZZ